MNVLQCHGIHRGCYACHGQSWKSRVICLVITSQFLFFLSTLTMSNVPGQSTQSAFRLGPGLSLDQGVPVFSVGELVLIRIPEEIYIDGYV